MRPAAPSLAALGVALALLAGCGEKDEPVVTGPVEVAELADADSFALTVEAFLSSPDAERVCDERLTADFLAEMYGDRAGCLESRRPANLAEPQTRMTVNPSDKITLVIAEPVGGLYAGKTLRITLIQEGDTYLIDSLESNDPTGP